MDLTHLRVVRFKRLPGWTCGREAPGVVISVTLLLLEILANEPRPSAAYYHAFDVGRNTHRQPWEPTSDRHDDYLAWLTCCIAASTIRSVVNPNSFCRTFNGAEAPNVVMPRMAPVLPA